jgi:hypothetical protein
LIASAAEPVRLEAHHHASAPESKPKPTVARLKRAIEGRDACALAALYSEDAVVQVTLCVTLGKLIPRGHFGVKSAMGLFWRWAREAQMSAVS